MFWTTVGVGAALVLSGVMALVFSVVIAHLKSSDVYLGAVARAESAPAVFAVLGTPLKPGYFARGNVHVSGPTGLAELVIPISGPNGHGTIYVAATKRLGEWHYDHLMVVIEKTGEQIDLAPTPRPSKPSPSETSHPVVRPK